MAEEGGGEVKTRDLTRFQRTLRLLAFKRVARYRDIQIYVRRQGAITLDVQLWQDGRHRVSHMYQGRGNTPPTSFRTLPQMLTAIQTENIRANRKRLRDPSWFRDPAWFRAGEMKR